MNNITIQKVLYVFGIGILFIFFSDAVSKLKNKVV